MAEVIIGIDLGTTFSLVSVFEGGAARVLEDERGRGLVPSVVRYLPPAPGATVHSGVVVGWEAREHAVEFPESTIASVKRLMGRSAADVGEDAAHLSYRVVAGPQETARVALPWGEVVSPQEVSAEILRALKALAERRLGHAVRRAVVTVPAYYDDAQRQATRDAGRLAGLEVVRIVNEPTAAALAYGLGARPGGGVRHVAVFDLGGGTFDVSVLRLTPPESLDPGDQTAFFQVLSTAGDTRLGGDDVDVMLVRLFTGEIMGALAARGVASPEQGPALDPATRQALRTLAESVKIRLSDRDEARVSIRVNEDLTYERVVTRGELESMMGAWVERAMDSCRRALRDARGALAGSGLDAVVLVGGSTRIPMVRRAVGEFFGLEPYTALDPDRVVAMGAGVQGGILSGSARGALLLDVIPLSLGIETVGGAVAKIILRNSGVPARATEMFSTSVDGQTSIRLGVYQGEREMAADCRRLAEFNLSGIPPMPAGIPQVAVEFLVDASGILRVEAVERRSGKRASIQVVPNHGLTPEEVDRIERESLAHAREDMARHRVVDLVANARLDLKWIGERLARFGSLLEPDARADLEGRVASVREMVESGARDWRSVDPGAFHAAKEGLDRASVRLQEISITQSLKEG